MPSGWSDERGQKSRVFEVEEDEEDEEDVEVKRQRGGDTQEERLIHKGRITRSSRELRREREKEHTRLSVRVSTRE